MVYGALLTEVGHGLEGDHRDARAVDDLDVRGNAIVAHQRRELEQRPLLRLRVVVLWRHRHHHVRVSAHGLSRCQHERMNSGDAPIGEIQVLGDAPERVDGALGEAARDEARDLGYHHRARMRLFWAGGDIVEEGDDLVVQPTTSFVSRTIAEIR